MVRMRSIRQRFLCGLLAVGAITGTLTCLGIGIGVDARPFSHEAKAASEPAALPLPTSDRNYSQASVSAVSSGTPSVWTQECSPTVAGAIRATFLWTPSNSGLQWLDLSLSDSGFAGGTFVGVGPLPGDAWAFGWDGLRPAATYYVRVNTLSYGLWFSGGTLVFRTGICGGPALLGPIAQSCSGTNADTTFSWTPSVPQGSVQWLDLSLSDNGFAPGTFVSAGPLASSMTWFRWPGLRPGQTHYWRVNTVTPSGWYASSTGSFFSDYCGTLPPTYTSPSPRYCCKICTTGKACGNSCISRSYTCHQPPGCACNG